MLVKHLHEFVGREEKDGFAVVKGEPFATIAAVEQNGEIKIGVTVCADYELFSKSFGRTVAIGRAMTGETGVMPSRKVYNSNIDLVNIAEVIQTEVEDMRKRANAYFKQVHHV